MSVSRRGLLGGGVWMVTAMQNLTAARDAVDHLLLGAADLDSAVAWVESLTGVRAAAGGSHPGMGTRNALLSLGRRQYLEIIAPDPAQAKYNFHVDVRAFKEPKLVGWAAVTRDIAGVAERAQGERVMGPRDGSRVRPDGKTLRWKTLVFMNPMAQSGVVPFFIEWAGDAVHPSEDSTKGCELQSFEIVHPEPELARAALEKLGIRAAVRQGKEAGLVAGISTPKGKVELR